MEKNKLRYKNIIAESYYKKENNKVAVVFCQGIPSTSSFQDLAEEYVEKGYIFVHPKYSGSWESYGAFSPSRCREDIISFVNALKSCEVKTVFGENFDIEIDKIFLMGHSFGGSIALCAGAELEVEGIVALAPIVDYRKHAKDEELQEESLLFLFDFLEKGFENVYRGLSKSDWSRFVETGFDLNPIDYVEKLNKKNILLIHGKGDSSIHVSRSRDFFGSLEFRGKDSKYVETDDTHSGVKLRPISQICSWMNDVNNESFFDS